jgi:hypothetical protein
MEGVDEQEGRFVIPEAERPTTRDKRRCLRCTRVISSEKGGSRFTMKFLPDIHF